MKIYINEERELLNISSVTERLRSDGTCVLDINLNDTTITVDELKNLFTGIATIKIIRIDLNEVEQNAIFTDYTQIEKIQRRICEESDIMTVTLIRPNSISSTEENI